MEVLIFQKEAFEEMAAKFSRFSDRVNELLAKQGSKSLNRWMDNQEVCQQLNISPRALQTLRDNGFPCQRILQYIRTHHVLFLQRILIGKVNVYIEFYVLLAVKKQTKRRLPKWQL